ncbi:MAG: hypothetical protein AAFR79_19800, partial [Pseudomonadota bacterium]
YKPGAEPLLELARRDAEREVLPASAIDRIREALREGGTVVALVPDPEAVAKALGQGEVLASVPQP